MFRPLSWPRVDGDFENEESELSNGSWKKKIKVVGRGGGADKLCEVGSGGGGEVKKLAGCVDGWETAIVCVGKGRLWFQGHGSHFLLCPVLPKATVHEPSHSGKSGAVKGVGWAG